MELDNITFENIDSPQDIAKKTVLIFAGSSELKTKMRKLKINYSKVDKGLKVRYILRGSNIGRLVVTL